MAETNNELTTKLNEMLKDLKTEKFTVGGQNFGEFFDQTAKAFSTNQEREMIKKRAGI